MRTPIVVVHGIGKRSRDPEAYYSAWRKKFPNAHFFNAEWSEFGFNVSMQQFQEEVDLLLSPSIGFSELSSRPVSVTHKLPLMERIFHYSQAKIKALDNYRHITPFWGRKLATIFDRIIFRFLGVESVDFIGDVFTYLKWEEYTNSPRNPILDIVTEKIQEAISFYPNTPIHIVCHSLGTKIVWDALNTLNLPEGTVGILMTLCSPLQPMKIFGWYRDGDNTHFRKPTCVDHWLNIYDVRDPIGAPIGGASFKLPDNLYLTMSEVLSKSFLYPCINICTPIGLFPWTAHTNAWKSNNPRRVFRKYLDKYAPSI